MNEIIIAGIGAVSAICVALVEKSRRENKRDHASVSEKLDWLGSSLGRSIDRVEGTALRTEQKVDQHIRDHAKGEFSE